MSGDMIGQKLGSFRIQAPLGGDAKPDVYRAVDETTGRPAALKALRGEERRELDRLQHGARILQRLRHPNVAGFLAMGRCQGTTYLAREFVTGATLVRVLAARGPLPWHEVAEVGLQ